jgi:hypothetical protein
VKDLSCALPLNPIHRTSSLDHGHKSPWWQEHLFFDGWLLWLDLLDRGGLVALLHHVRRRVRWCWWTIVSYHTCHRLLCLHPFLKCSTKAKEFPALNEEMSRSLHSIFVDVGVPCAPPHRASLPLTVVVDHDVGATLFLASNRGQRFCYCFRSSCSHVVVHRNCRRGRYSRSMLLPYPLHPRHRSGFGNLSFES